MINIESQETLFKTIGRALPKQLTVYSIGGTAMMLRGLKGETLDIDIVFDKEADRNLFTEVLESMKFRKDERRVIETYGLKRNTPMMLRLESADFVIDLFLSKVITSTFSETMKKRANQTHEYGNLLIKVADPMDILIMKSVTSRAKDEEDIISIINNNKMQWNTILEEAQEQVALGNEGAIFSLGERLEKLVHREAVTVPKEVLDKIIRLHNKSVDKRKKKL